MDTVFNILIVALGVAFIIFIHELGHFAVAKWLKMRVEAFSIGFGKVIWSFTRGETEYRLSLIPLGGYVKLSGETPDDASGDDDFFNRPPGQRALVLVAGVVMNVVSGVAMLFAAFLIGIKVIEPEIGGIAADSPAAQMGLEVGDRVTHVDGERVFSFSDFRHKVAVNGGDPVRIDWTREGEAMHGTLTPEYNERIGLYLMSVMDRPLAVVGAVSPDPESAAARAGLEARDTIREIKIGEGSWAPITYFDEFETAVRESEGTPLQLKGTRADGSEFQTAYTAQPVYRFGTSHGSDERRTLMDRLFGGAPSPTTLNVTDVVPGFPAAEIGVLTGDVIESIAVAGSETPAKPVKTLGEFSGFIREHPGATFQVWWHSAKEQKQLSATFTPKVLWGPDFASVPNYVVSSVPLGSPGLLVTRSFEKAHHDFMGVLRSLKSFLTGDVAAKNINGPISIARVSMRFAELGLGSFLAFLAMISFNLAILNILPIPLLDGGHLLLVGIEKILGRQVDEKIQIAMQYVGIALLGSLMLLAFFNDIFRPAF